MDGTITRFGHSPAFTLLGVFAASMVVFVRADAHAIIAEASPPANSTVVGPHVKIRLRFNVRIDHSRSRLVLVLPGGTLKPLAIREDEAPDTLAVEENDLASGSYILRWQVLANDGHITRGEIPFKVRAP